MDWHSDCSCTIKPHFSTGKGGQEPSLTYTAVSWRSAMESPVTFGCILECSVHPWHQESRWGTTNPALASGSVPP